MGEVGSEFLLTAGFEGAFGSKTQTNVSKRQAVAPPIVRSGGAKGSYLHGAVSYISRAVSGELVHGGVPCAVHL